MVFILVKNSFSPKYVVTTVLRSPHDIFDLYIAVTSLQQPLFCVPWVAVVGRLHCTYMEFSFRRSPAKNLHTCYKSSHAQSNGNQKYDNFKSYFRVKYQERGFVVKWLERLDYGAESHHKVVGSRLGFAMRRLENSLCQPTSEWVPFSN